jgi:hypothetical protein
MAAIVMLMRWMGNWIWTTRRVEEGTVNGAVRDALENREDGNNSAKHEANVGSGTNNDFYKQCIQGHAHQRERRPKIFDIGMNHDNRSITTSTTAFASIVLADDDDAVPLVDVQPYSSQAPAVIFQNAQ